MNVAPEWIPYRRGVQILRALGDVVEGQDAARGLYLLTGPPNNGKTAIVDQLRRIFRTRADPAAERSHIPLLALDMPPRPAVHAILRKALASTGAPVMPCPLDRGILYLGSVLRGCGARLIVLDDAQHILAGMPAQRRLFLSFWTAVADRAGAALLLAGTARVFELGPLVEKARLLLSLPAWPLDQEFVDMVRALERHLSPEHPFIGAADIPILHTASGGRLGAMVAVMMRLTGHSPIWNEEWQVALEQRFRHAEDVV